MKDNSTIVTVGFVCMMFGTIFGSIATIVFKSPPPTVQTDSSVDINTDKATMTSISYTTERGPKVVFEKDDHGVTMNIMLPRFRTKEDVELTCKALNKAISVGWIR